NRDAHEERGDRGNCPAGGEKRPHPRPRRHPPPPCLRPRSFRGIENRRCVAPKVLENSRVRDEQRGGPQEALSPSSLKLHEDCTQLNGPPRRACEKPGQNYRLTGSSTVSTSVRPEGFEPPTF